MIACQCPGAPYIEAIRHLPCPNPVTQEDFLCDQCRRFDCPTCVTPDVTIERAVRVLAELAAR